MNARIEHQTIPGLVSDHQQEVRNVQPASFAVELARRGVFASLAGAVLGGAAAVAIVAGTQSLPVSQVLPVFAVIAAGLAFLAAVASIRDQIPTRAVLRTVLSAAAGFSAYAALGNQWSLIGAAFTMLVAWSLMEWFQEGHNPVVSALLSGTSVLTLVSFAQI